MGARLPVQTRHPRLRDPGHPVRGALRARLQRQVLARLLDWQRPVRQHRGEAGKEDHQEGQVPDGANFNCETFWYDGGDCDELNGEAVNVQMVAKTLTSAPALAVGALLAVALIAVKARRSQYAEL